MSEKNQQVIQKPLFGVIEDVGGEPYFHRARDREAAEQWVSWDEALTLGVLENGDFKPFMEATN